MKRCCAIVLLSGAALMLAQLPALAGAESSNRSVATERHEAANRLRFVDEDGDGLNDLVADSDGDGIPNSSDDGKRSIADRALKELFHYSANLPYQSDGDGRDSPANTSGTARSGGGGR